VIFIRGVSNLSRLDVKSLEVVCVGLEVLYLAIYECRQLGMKGRRLHMEDAFLELLLCGRGDALEGEFSGVGIVIFLLNIL
jgi:hypothetical protein